MLEKINLYSHLRAEVNAKRQQLTINGVMPHGPHKESQPTVSEEDAALLNGTVPDSKILIVRRGHTSQEEPIHHESVGSPKVDSLVGTVEKPLID